MKDFWSCVDKNGPIPEHNPALENCWLWTGAKFVNGYGRYGNERAHRVSKKLTGEPIPDKLDGLHECDVKLCVRPTHIVAGTNEYNMQQAVQRGKILRGEQHPFKIDPSRAARGIHTGLAKLSDDKVVEMRELRKTTNTSYASIGKRFGVSKIAARLAIIGATWAHVPNPVWPEK